MKGGGHVAQIYGKVFGGISGVGWIGVKPLW